MATSNTSNAFVSTQFILFLCYMLANEWCAIDVHISFFYTGLSIAILGGYIMLSAFIKLGKALTPFPEPKKEAFLIRSGVYHYIRHPIYTGVMGLAWGYALMEESGTKLLFSLLITILFLFKARYEETLLEKSYPDYGIYKDMTGMFLPVLRKLFPGSNSP